jgi:hypothetical protein
VSTRIVATCYKVYFRDISCEKYWNPIRFPGFLKFFSIERPWDPKTVAITGFLCGVLVILICLVWYHLQFLEREQNWNITDPEVENDSSRVLCPRLRGRMKWLG